MVLEESSLGEDLGQVPGISALLLEGGEWGQARRCPRRHRTRGGGVGDEDWDFRRRCRSRRVASSAHGALLRSELDRHEIQFLGSETGRHSARGTARGEGSPGRGEAGLRVQAAALASL